MINYNKPPFSKDLLSSQGIPKFYRETLNSVLSSKAASNEVLPSLPTPKIKLKDTNPKKSALKINIYEEYFKIDAERDRDIVSKPYDQLILDGSKLCEEKEYKKAGKHFAFAYQEAQKTRNEENRKLAQEKALLILYHIHCIRILGDDRTEKLSLTSDLSDLPQEQAKKLKEHMKTFEAPYKESDKIVVIRSTHAFGAPGAYEFARIFAKANGKSHKNAASTYIHKDFTWVSPAAATGHLTIQPKSYITQTLAKEPVIIAGDGSTKHSTYLDLITGSKTYEAHIGKNKLHLKQASINDLHAETIRLQEAGEKYYKSQHVHNELLVQTIKANNLTALYFSLDNPQAFPDRIFLYLNQILCRTFGKDIPIVFTHIFEGKRNFYLQKEQEKYSVEDALREMFPFLSNEEKIERILEVFMYLHGSYSKKEKGENETKEFQFNHIVLDKKNEILEEIIKYKDYLFNELETDKDLKPILQKVKNLLNEEIKSAVIYKIEKRQKKVANKKNIDSIENFIV